MPPTRLRSATHLVDQAVVRRVNGQEFGMEFTRIRLAEQERLRAPVMKAKL